MNLISYFNQILLSLFDTSNVFHDSFLANIEAKNVLNDVNISDVIMKCNLLERTKFT